MRSCMFLTAALVLVCFTSYVEAVVGPGSLEPFPTYNCHHCLCSLCGDPQLNACNGSRIHVGMDLADPEHHEVKMLQASGEPGVYLTAYVKLSHVEGQPENHLRKEYLAGYATADHTTGIGANYKIVPNVGISLALPGPAPLTWRLMGPGDDASVLLPGLEAHIVITDNDLSGNCFGFEVKRNTFEPLENTEIKFCHGCVSVNATEDLFRNGICQDPLYQGEIHCQPEQEGEVPESERVAPELLPSRK